MKFARADHASAYVVCILADAETRLEPVEVRSVGWSTEKVSIHIVDQGPGGCVQVGTLLKLNLGLRRS